MQTITNTRPKEAAMNQEEFNTESAALDVELRQALIEKFALEASLLLGYEVFISIDGQLDVPVDFELADTEPCPAPEEANEWRPLETVYITEDEPDTQRSGFTLAEEGPESLEPTTFFEMPCNAADSGFGVAHARFSNKMQSRSSKCHWRGEDGWSTYVSSNKDPATVVPGLPCDALLPNGYGC